MALALANAFDFVGIAFHEIGHVLGFYSGTDWLDWYPYNNELYTADEYIVVNPLDLFRFSAESVAYGPGVFDWTVDEREKYFSIDGGATNAGATFSTGWIYGDGWQPGHWKDGTPGIMDPTFNPGELGVINPVDLRAFDVIGYDLRAAAVPEPSSLAMAGVGLACLAWFRRRRGG